MPNTLLLFGAGPGIGSHIASVFASSGSISHVVLLGRNTQRLQDSDVPFVSSASPGTKVSYLHVDLSDVASIPGVLRELDELTSGEEVEVVYYNAARIKPSEGVLSVDVQEIEEDFRVRIIYISIY
jgi:NADP-dependent 3-hydroxy acid dehydrogenase YdfG